MNIVTVKDKKTGAQYSYDANMVIRTSDDGLAFFTSQLAYVDATIYQTKYRKIVYQDFVPVVTTDPEWTDTYTYFSYDAVTVGKFIAANGQDLPESDITAAKHSAELHYGGNAFSYSLDELRKSQMLRIPVDTTKGQMSFRGFQEHAQQVAFFGDSSRGITGVFNNANVPLDNSTVDWDTASGQEIIDDMNSLLIKVWENSAQVHLPNRLVLPANRWAQITNQRMETGTDTTVLEFFMKNNLYTAATRQELQVMQNLEIQTAGVAGAQRMFAYEVSDENLTMRMPITWRTIAPQSEGLRVKVPCEYKFGGVEYRYPLSAAYRDFI